MKCSELIQLTELTELTIIYPVYLYLNQTKVGVKYECIFEWNLPLLLPVKYEPFFNIRKVIYHIILSLFLSFTSYTYFHIYWVPMLLTSSLTFPIAKGTISPERIYSKSSLSPPTTTHKDLRLPTQPTTNSNYITPSPPTEYAPGRLPLCLLHRSHLLGAQLVDKSSACLPACLSDCSAALSTRSGRTVAAAAAVAQLTKLLALPLPLPLLASFASYKKHLQLPHKF